MSIISKITLIATSLVVFMSTAEATDISADGVHRYFEFNKKPIQSIVVTNNDASRTFEMNLKVERVVSTDVKTGLVTLEPAPDDFMFAPRSFILGPKEKRNLRVVYTKGFDEKEHRYRLTFSPKERVGLRNDEDAQGLSFGTNMVSVVGIAIMVAPVKKDVSIIFERTKEGVVFKNTGNVTAVLRPKVEHCSESACVTVRRSELNPGEVWFFAMPKDMSINWYYDVYDKTQRNPLIINAY